MRYIDLPEVKKKYACAKWKKTRRLKLEKVNYFCERCIKKNIYNTAIIVHHKKHVNESNYMYDDIFYNLDNLEALCIACHNEEHFKENIEEYAFDEEGNVVKREGYYNGR